MFSLKINPPWKSTLTKNMSSSKIHQNYLGPYGQPDAKNIREWTKPLIPTVFPAASPGIQAYQRQSLNFANGQLSVSLKDRPGLDLGETLWNIQLSPYKETGGSNQSQS